MSFVLITVAYKGKRKIERSQPVGQDGTEAKKYLQQSEGFTGGEVADLFQGYPVETSTKSFSLVRK